MRKELRPVVAAALLVLAAGALAAQEKAAAPRFYVLHQEVAKPSMLKQYEETTREFIAHVRRHHDLVPAFDFLTVAGEDFVYSYLAQVQGFADLDAFHAGFAKLPQAVGEAKWADLMRRGGLATESVRESVLMEDPSLSYTPARPRLKENEQAYLHVDLYYVMPGFEPEAEAVARDFVELSRRKGVANGFRFFKVLLGPETPLYMVVVGAKDPADFQAQDAAGRQLLGAEGQALFQRAFAITRRYEHHGGWIRPDLSLEPVQQARK